MAEAADWSGRDVAHMLRLPTADDDKYSRGVVGLRTGSREYPGAAVLGVEGAWRTGVGMVRYTGPARDLVLARRPETVAVDGRADAWVVGSGTDAATRGPDETAALRRLLDGDTTAIVDAGALDLAIDGAAPRIVTPHDGEHARLREALGLVAPAGEASADSGAGIDRVTAALESARELGAVVLLKGAVTIVASPDGEALRVEAGIPWLATAGTGDVLAGAVGALVASWAASGRPADAADLARLAASAAWLHGLAAALAAADLGGQGGPITALDVATSLPRAVAGILADA